MLPNSPHPPSVHAIGKWVVRLIVASFGVLAVAGAGAAAAQAPPGPEPRVLSTTVTGPITPVIAAHIADGIDRAQREGYDAYLVHLDTPGGLDTSMRSIVRDVLGSTVPVVVYISPQGARGASAGAVISFSAHVAAMAPGTAIGAATPVSSAGDDLDAKVVNDAVAYVESLAELRDRNVEFAADTVRDGRSATASEALEVGAIDAIASSAEELLEMIDGRTVVVGDAEREVVMRTAGATIDEQDLGFFRTIQQLLADPNVSFLFMSIGTLGLIYELASPGIGVGAVVGLTFVVLGLFGLAVLPVNAVGILLLLLAGALFIAEIAAPGIGIAAAGGAFALVMSGIFLIDDAPGLEISLAVVIPVAVVVGVFVVVAGRFALKARRAPSTTTGPGVLMGQRAPVRRHDDHPQVFVSGAWWRICADRDAPLPAAGSLVEVVDVDGLDLVVQPVTSGDHPVAATGDLTTEEAP